MTTRVPTDADSGDMDRIGAHLLRLMLIVGGLYVYYVLFTAACLSATCGGAVYRQINLLGQAVLLVATVWTSARMIREDLTTIWTGAALFPLSTGLFFGFGNMVYIFGQEATLSHLGRSVFGITQQELTRANLLTMLGVFCALAAFCTVLRMVSPGTARTERSAAPVVPVGIVAAAFLGTGLVLKFGVILPAEFSISDRVVPGVIKGLAGLADLGFALAAYRSVRGSRLWTVVFWSLWPIHFLLGLVQFSKEVTMLAILLPAIGAFLAHRSYRRLAVWIAATVILFPILQEVNTAGRLLVQMSAAVGDPTTLGERVEMMERFVVRGESIHSLSGRALYLPEKGQVWWARLAYAGPQVRAMQQHDFGQGGEWYQPVLFYLIPRFIWPNKPSVEHPGEIFYQATTGSPVADSKVGLSVYAEGYWIYGWVGTIAFSAIMGAILGLMTILSYRQIARRDFIYLPAVLQALQTAAIGPTGFLQTNIIGGLPTYLGLLFVLWAAKAVLLQAGSPAGAARPPGPERPWIEEGGR